MPSRVGIDLTSVTAVREAIDAHGDRYLERVYTPQELLDCGGDASRLAGRFAAKEAVIKVLRPASDTPLPWTEIEVLRHPEGHIGLRLAGLALGRAEQQGLEVFALSLSHEGDSACAVVLAEGKCPTCR